MKANEIDLFFSQSPSPLIQHQLQFHTLIIPQLVAPKIQTLLDSKFLRRWEIRISPDADQKRSHIKSRRWHRRVLSHSLKTGQFILFSLHYKSLHLDIFLAKLYLFEKLSHNHIRIFFREMVNSLCLWAFCSKCYICYICIKKLYIYIIKCLDTASILRLKNPFCLLIWLNYIAHS